MNSVHVVDHSVIFEHIFFLIWCNHWLLIAEHIATHSRVINAMLSFQEYRNKPNYSVLVDSRDRDVQTTYVAEDNIEIVTDTVIKHPQVDEYFDFYDGAQYHMRPALKQMYPYD